MQPSPHRVLDPIALLAGSLYVAGAVGYRVAAVLGGRIEPLASLYHALPGALAGATLYAAWTGLRGRPQSAWGLVTSAIAAGAAAELLRTRLIPLFATRLPPGASFPDRAIWELLCDLSGITILFALLLVGFAPISGGRAAGPGLEE